MMETFSPDYARFTIESDGLVNVGERMKKKIDAIPFPDMKGMSVLDVGCDYGQFSFYAANNGASYVRGLDRNRDVKGVGKTDLVSINNHTAKNNTGLGICEFSEVNLGKQWKEFGQYDLIFVFSMYHHFFQNVGDHQSIWFWLWNHCNDNATVLWENPVDMKDVVSDRHISGNKREIYTREKIIESASKYFDVEYIGGAKHEPHREVYRFTKKDVPQYKTDGVLVDGAKGASKAFEYLDGRRCKEIENILGYYPFAGSLNIITKEPFDWNSKYYRAEVLDVVKRGSGLSVDWKPRYVRLYPVTIDGINGHVFRFEGESYPANFIEVIAPKKLRDLIRNDVVEVVS